MANSSDGRLFPEEEAPTGKFAGEQLDALVARSLEKSTMFDASLDGPPADVIPVAGPPTGPTPSAPEFLGKGAAVLVLPAEAEPAPPPLVRVETRERPAAASAVPVVPVVPLVPIVPAVRTRPRISARPDARPRRARIRVLKLALLALVVACQPWWWNVGDVSAHPKAHIALAR